MYVDVPDQNTESDFKSTTLLLSLFHTFSSYTCLVVNSIALLTLTGWSQ